MFKMFGWIGWLRGSSQKIGPGKVDYQSLADASDERAANLHINPPRFGRKTYQQRYSESSSKSTSELKSILAERQGRNQECGVILRILADRGE